MWGRETEKVEKGLKNHLVVIANSKMLEASKAPAVCDRGQVT